MDYLQICRRLARACGMTGKANIPSSVVGQTGNLLDAVEWANDAYTELQMSRRWRWLRSKFTLDTAALTDEYAYSDFHDARVGGAIDRFDSWIVNDRYNPPRAYLTSGGQGAQYFLQYVDWEVFRSLYKIGVISSGAPVHITVDPQNNIVIGPTPNDVYTITGEYNMSPQVLANNSDVPEMPEQFHMLIVYEAMRKYAGDQAAQEVMVRAVNEGGWMRDQLMMNQLPTFRQGRPMA